MPDNNWIDISVPLRSGMVHWPGDPEPLFTRISEISQGADANVTFCRCSAHTGTHMDAPCHFLPGEKGIDQFPIEVGFGPARVIAVDTESNGIVRRGLEGKGIQRGERLLLKTRNSDQRWSDLQFLPDFVALHASGAEFLAEAGVALIGVDYLSVGVFQSDGAETHKALLRAGIWILEGLDLSRATEGSYELICLPLRIEGSDGSPARAVIRPIADQNSVR